MQTASKETQTEAGAWIIPGRQSQTLLEDFERERDLLVASLSGDADYASDKEKKGRPVPVFAPESASGRGCRTPRRSPPAPSRPAKMSADVGCGIACQSVRPHCCSEQNAACSGDSAQLHGGCVNFCSGRREMSSSVFARASSPPGSVLFAENKLTTAASTKTTTLPTTPSPSQPRCHPFGVRSSLVFLEEVLAALVKKRARDEDEEDYAYSCDKASASQENKDDGGRDSSGPPSKKKRAISADSATAFAKKRAGIEDDDRVTYPGDNDNSDDDCWPRQKKRAPLAVGFPVEETEKKKQTGARGPLFARWGEAVRRDKFTCRRSECGAGASLLSPVAVCFEEPDVSALLEASQISEADVASSAAVASAAAETKAAASNEQLLRRRRRRRRLRKRKRMPRRRLLQCFPSLEKDSLVGNCTDVPGPERRKGESLAEDEDDWSSGCYVPKDDTDNDDNDDKVKNDDKDDDDGYDDDDDDKVKNDDDDGDDDDDDADEFLSLPVLKYFGHLDTWLCGNGWRRRENSETSEEQNLLSIFGSVSRELFKLLVPIYCSGRKNFVCRHDDDDEQLPRFGFAGGSCSNCVGWKNKREKFGNREEKNVARLLEKAVFETSLEFGKEGGLVAALRPSVVAALKKRAGRFVGVFLGDRRDCFPCRSRRVWKQVLQAQLDVLKNCKIGCSELLLRSSGGRPATKTKRKLVFYSESEDDEDDKDKDKAADRRKK